MDPLRRHRSRQSLTHRQRQRPHLTHQAKGQLQAGQQVWPAIGVVGWRQKGNRICWAAAGRGGVAGSSWVRVRHVWIVGRVDWRWLPGPLGGHYGHLPGFSAPWSLRLQRIPEQGMRVPACHCELEHPPTRSGAPGAPLRATWGRASWSQARRCELGVLQAPTSALRRGRGQATCHSPGSQPRSSQPRLPKRCTEAEVLQHFRASL